LERRLSIVLILSLSKGEDDVRSNICSNTLFLPPPPSR